jgi:hypothetical protein
MGELTTLVGGKLVDSSLASFLISGLILLAMVATRQPARRRAIARAGVIGMLLTLPLVWARPFAPLDLIEPTSVALGNILDRLGFPPNGGGVASHFLTSFLPSGFLVAYALGVTYGLGRLALGAWGSGWIARNSCPASEEAEALYQTLPFPPYRWRPRLAVSLRITRPVLLGSFRPTILIPPNLDIPESISPLRLALLHELAHAEASDPWFGIALELASVFWFWLPPLWWIRHQARLDQEFLADRRAADGFGASSRYAASLVALAAPCPPEGAIQAPTPRRAPGSALIPRVLMLIRCPFPLEGRPPLWWLWSLFAVTAIALFAATGISLRVAAGGAHRCHVLPENHSISIPRIILQPEPVIPQPTTLPIRLPAEFDLSFELLANALQLSEIQILGNSLGPVPIVVNELLEDEQRLHRVKVRRRKGLLYLSLDDEPLRQLSNNAGDEWFNALGGRKETTIFRTIHLTW